MRSAQLFYFSALFCFSFHVLLTRFGNTTSERLRNKLQRKRKTSKSEF